jgi:hypothetical protein
MGATSAEDFWKSRVSAKLAGFKPATLKSMGPPPG